MTITPLKKLALAAITLTILAGCATILRNPFDEAFGPTDPTRFDRITASKSPATPSFRKDVLPILESRCVVCHACYDAPCQLKLSSLEGVTRGASPEIVYDQSRLKEAAPSRLYIDAEKTSEWRSKGFHPVLNERRNDPDANLNLSPLYRILAQKVAHPLPATPVLSDDFDFSLNREQQCPAPEEFDRYEKKQPLAGMPYGLPGLSPAEHATLRQWIADGAPGETPPPPPKSLLAEVAKWEAFFNGSSAKEQLVARYIYEHLFLGHIYFGPGTEQQWFRLVRSSTPPGQPIRMLASRRPVNDPGPGKFYYRLMQDPETVVAKTHMPYRLDNARMKRWRELFLGPDIVVNELPPYGISPFEAYKDIPVNRRYQFMLDEAGYFVDGFIKGPVCRGQVALNVINDRFWVFFADPSTHDAETDAFIAGAAGTLRLPTESGSSTPVTAWSTYRDLERKYLDAQAQYLSSRFAARGPTTSIIWDGGQRNPNAALTIFRHFDSASVVQGLVGTPPKTAWILTYALFERIHYLLVAEYDVYGNVGHQLNARLYMDFMRMEGETNILMLLPKASRLPTLDSWYREDSDQIREKFFESEARSGIETAIPFRTGNHVGELYDLLRQRVSPASTTEYDLATVKDLNLRESLQKLAALRGRGVSLLPETTFLQVDLPGGGVQDFTILRDSAHSSISNLFTERRARRPDQDALTVVPGMLGAYPNAFYRLKQSEIPELASAISALREEKDYTRLADRFAVRRTASGIWAHLDALHERTKKRTPIELGRYDLNRLENR